MDCSPPVSSVLGILQARILEWVTITFSGRSSPPRDGNQVSCIAGEFFTIWVSREALCKEICLLAAPMLTSWDWVNSRSWWWTRRPGVLGFIGSQRVGHEWVTELNWTELMLTSPVVPVVKNLPAYTADAGDVGLVPGWGRSPGVGNGNPLQDSCLENSMDRGTWWAIVHGVAKSRTQLSIRACDRLLQTSPGIIWG